VSRVREREELDRWLRCMQVSLEGEWKGPSELESATRSMLCLLASNTGLTNPGHHAAALVHEGHEDFFLSWKRTFFCWRKNVKEIWEWW